MKSVFTKLRDSHQAPHRASWDKFYLRKDHMTLVFKKTAHCHVKWFPP